jgi:hypothetical protein
MRTFGDDFKKDVEIDRFKLDEENEIQPSMYAYYAEQLSEVKSEKDSLVDKLQVLLAQKDLYYRRNPPEDLKITENVVKSLVDSDMDVMSARDSLRRAEAQLSLMYAAINSFDQRKSALDNLTKLHLQKYYQDNNSKPYNNDRILDDLNKGDR